MTSYQEIALDGIWRNNPALVQMLGLCPLLAVSSHLVTALGLGIITLLVLLSSNILISLIRTHLHEQVRLPIQILIIASSVTLADLYLQAYFYELHQRIGLFVALIVTNCTILGRAELLASRSPVKYALLDGIMMVGASGTGQPSGNHRPGHSFCPYGYDPRRSSQNPDPAYP